MVIIKIIYIIVWVNLFGDIKFNLILGKFCLGIMDI